jgi:hypothetical protein
MAQARNARAEELLLLRCAIATRCMTFATAVPEMEAGVAAGIEALPGTGYRVGRR